LTSGFRGTSNKGSIKLKFKMLEWHRFEKNPASIYADSMVTNGWMHRFRIHPVLGDDNGFWLYDGMEARYHFATPDEAMAAA
jgi:hypothetical protein